jgi:hypothetical protein
VVLVAILAALLGLLGEVGGLKVMQTHERGRLAASIARLEIETGIVDAPPDLYTTATQLNYTVARWKEAAASKQTSYSTGRTNPRRTPAGLSRAERAIIARANSGHKTTQAEWTTIREGSYRRWLQGQTGDVQPTNPAYPQSWLPHVKRGL